MALACGFEPLNDVAVEPQMHRGLSGRRYHTRVFPEILSERLSFGRVLACLILAARRLASISLTEYLTVVDFALTLACLLRS
jgi:hypothetical protein